MVKQTHANDARPTQMPLKIGVMGGATGVVSREILDGAHTLGRAIAASGCILVTGGCPGLPLAAACGAKEAGGFVVGISPGLSLDEHVYKYGSPTEQRTLQFLGGAGTFASAESAEAFRTQHGGRVRSLQQVRAETATSRAPSD